MSTLQNKNTQIEFIAGNNEFSLIYQQRLILRHTAQAPRGKNYRAAGGMGFAFQPGRQPQRFACDHHR